MLLASAQRTMSLKGNLSVPPRHWISPDILCAGVLSCLIKDLPTYAIDPESYLLCAALFLHRARPPSA